MVDITTLASQLGISAQAVRERIAKLGITPEQVKPAQGRTRAMLTPEQVELVASYAVTKATQDDADGLLDETAEEAAYATTIAIQHMGGMAQALATNVEDQATAIEDRLALAIQTRLSQIPQRAYTKAVSRLVGKKAPLPSLELDLGLFRPAPVLTATQKNLYADNL